MAANPQPQQQNSDRSSEQQTARPGPAAEKRYRVLETAEIPRGGSNFMLPKGKTIGSFGYDIDALKSQGVKLEEVA